MWILSRILLVWVALGAGFAVAGGFVAFVTLIGIVPRLSAITKTASKIRLYETCLAIGLVDLSVSCRREKGVEA